MPLPHFLLTLAAVLIAALLTIWVAFAADLAPLALGIVALIAAAAVHILRPSRDDQGAQKPH